MTRQTTRDTFIEEAEELLRVIDEDVSEETYDRGREFFVGVEERAKQMLSSVRDDGQLVSGAMLQAIRNMAGGVEKWVR